MAFIVPHDPLTPRRRLAVEIDPAARIVRASDLAAYRDAEQAMAAARAQAGAIVEEARAAFESERKRGYEEGRELARREAAQHMAEQVARADAYFAQIEGRLVALLMQAMRKIVEGYDEHERVLHCARNALAVVRNQKQLTLRVPVERAEHVRARASELLADYPGVELLDVVPDARLADDACVLESEIGTVEASTQGQLAALEGALRKVQAVQAGGHSGAGHTNA
jgi:type III secretion protein L